MIWNYFIVEFLPFGIRFDDRCLLFSLTQLSSFLHFHTTDLDIGCWIRLFRRWRPPIAQHNDEAPCLHSSFVLPCSFENIRTVAIYPTLVRICRVGRRRGLQRLSAASMLSEPLRGLFWWNDKPTNTRFTCSMTLRTSATIWNWLQHKQHELKLFHCLNLTIWHLIWRTLPLVLLQEAAW